jgi:hypothetical protein
MKRVTEKGTKIRGFDIAAQMYNKLYELEDIEEEYAIQDNNDLKQRLNSSDKYHELCDELGIDLVILFEALKNGVYVKLWELNTNTPEIYSTRVTLNYPLLMVANSIGLAFKDYGKTWALTKEELL